jgi:putative ABC transport system permease protein
MFSEWLDNLRLRLKALLKRDQLDRDLGDELTFHLAMREEQNRIQGMPVDEARYAARRQFGNYTQTKERTREMWTFSLLESFLQDLQFAQRMLRKNLGFTVVAVLTLALGIGANTAIFSVINSALLQPLPFDNPDRLVRIYTSQNTPTNLPVSGEDYFDWQKQARSFERMCIYSSPQSFNASGAGEPETVSVDSTEANFFSLLGVPPQVGRAFAAGEDRKGNNHVAVLSAGFAARHFGGAAEALGKAVRLDFQPYTVIGVMPARFNYPEDVDAWIPLEMSLETLGRRGNYSYRVLARLKPGVTIAEARADMAAVAANIARDFPLTNTNEGTHVVPFKEVFTGGSRPQLLVLLGTVGLVLLVACTNVANLLLARATARQREIALRAALGAGRGRLVRQLLTESLLLSFAGAGLGLLGARWLVRFAQSTSALPLPRQNPIQLDATVLLFTVGVGLLVGILFGLAPALEASRVGLSEELRLSAHSVAGASGWRLALRNGLVIAEIAASLALLAGAGLLLRTFSHLRNADIGVRTENVLTAAVVLPETKYTAAADRREFYDRLLERVRQIPGVESAALAQQIPLEGSHGNTANLPGAADSLHAGLSVNVNFVSPDYFRLWRLPFLSGRAFTPEEINRAYEAGRSSAEYWDAGGKPLDTPQPQWSSFAIINRTMARQLWPNQEAVGKVFINNLTQPVTVVGVVADEKYGSIREPDAPEEYFPVTAELTNKWYPPNILVRTATAPDSVLGGIRSALHDLDTELSLFRVRTMSQVVSENMQDTTLQTILLGSFAALGLLLSAVGIYGVMAFLVTQRTHEIGIRMALGAQRRQILGLVIGRGLNLTVAGVVIGIVLSLALTRLLSRELFGVSANDPLTFIGVSILLAIVALAACYIPARRATAVDPLVALRYE